MRIFLAALILFAPLSLPAQDAAGYFQKNCAPCHTIGSGRLVGPDLQGVLSRKDRAWLEAYIQDPKAMIDKGDPYAKSLLADSNGLLMPNPPGITAALAKSLLDFIAGESGSASAPAVPSPEPALTPEDSDHGREIVLGSRSLTNGGPPCISCHTSRDLPSLGGGALGPDLTEEFRKLGGAKAVTAWLSSPPTPNMQSVYRDHPLQPEEIRALVAWFQNESKPGEPAPVTGRLLFLALGLGGCLIALVLMDIVWRNRFRAVRRPLVSGQRGSR